MINNETAYLIGSLVLLVIWLPIYFLNKKQRKEIFIVSLLIGSLSVISAYIWWTMDWWKPLTITGTRVGIEDFIMGFAAGGIVSVIYEVIFKTKSVKKLKNRGPHTFLIMVLILFIISVLFWLFQTTSFIASTVAMIIGMSLFFIIRKDLIIDGVVSGILMVLISIPFYKIIIYINNNWVKETYLLENLSGILFLGIPIEEFVFWFLLGCIAGPFYEFWKGEKILLKK